MKEIYSDSNKLARSRKNHDYADPGQERTTPLEEIPDEFQMEVPLPGGKKQIVDKRLCYNWQPGPDGGRLVECGSVWADADKQGFISPEENNLQETK